LVVAFFVLWIGGISVRLVHLQVNQHAWLREKALDMRQDVRHTQMLRGTIFDRNERYLAISLPVKTLYIDPTEVSDPPAAAAAIGKALKIDSKRLAAQIQQGKEDSKRFLPILKKVENDDVLAINKTLYTPELKKADMPNFEGLHWRDDQLRSYPYESLAAQVIGFSDGDDKGKAGIEMSQDEVLHGAVIKKVQERDRLGRVYDETIIERDTPSDIVLTIDTGFQYMTEQALERGVRAADARSGMAIVMVPKTGEILAMANYPSFDPNVITESAKEHISNKAIQSVYSPGSVFKIVTYGSALERHLFSPDDTISAGNGTITVARHTFTDSHGIGTVSYSQAMAHSSNVCAIKTAMRVGKEDFSTLVKKMGFGSRTGIELPTETQGIVRPVEKWNGDSLASMSIGYEISVSALQMATAFATIANDGVRAQPHIIKEIRHSDDRPKTVTQVKQTQVVTADTARHLKTMLRQVVLTGTGRRAQLNGYTAAGKTGTAWKFDAKSRSVDSSKYISSFIGMAPAENPEIVVLVVMDEPKSGARDGGMVSAPVFKEIAQQILTEMKIPADAKVKAESLIAEVVPESPRIEAKRSDSENKKENVKPEKKKADAKADENTRPRTVEPAAKEKPKPKDPKKKIDKKGADPDKLSAGVRREKHFFNVAQRPRAKIET
ncbi:MAG: peptidoglycan D,D-transpeptidase FtsI family protein, partial [Pyrinomonadaceae bacterium]